MGCGNVERVRIRCLALQEARLCVVIGSSTWYWIGKKIRKGSLTSR